jgi:hypothetical protein
MLKRVMLAVTPCSRLQAVPAPLAHTVHGCTLVALVAVLSLGRVVAARPRALRPVVDERAAPPAVMHLCLPSSGAAAMAAAAARCAGTRARLQRCPYLRLVQPRRYEPAAHHARRTCHAIHGQQRPALFDSQDRAWGQVTCSNRGRQ